MNDLFNYYRVKTTNMVYQHTIQNYTFTLSGWGENKTKRPGSNLLLQNSCPFAGIQTEPDISIFGQDVLGVLARPSFIIIANADGHSGRPPVMQEGIDFAYYSVKYIIDYVSSNIDTIRKIYKNDQEIKQFMNSIFQNIDNRLLYDELKGHISGGSTLTITIKFVHNGKLVSLTTNTGDSSLFVVPMDTNSCGDTPSQMKPREITSALNCDTLKNYNIYIDKCNEKQIKPISIFLGRFNYRKKSFRVTWVDALPIPLRPFELVKEGDIYKAYENTNTMERFYKNAPIDFIENVLEKGGTQTIRDMELNKKMIEDGRYPSTNFGNTAEGVCQCLPGASIGDIQQKTRKDIMITHTSVYTYKSTNQSNREIIGSDGFFDSLTDKSIMECSVEDTETTRNNLIHKMFGETFKHKWNPGWDDISMCVIDINYVKPKKKNAKNKLKIKRENRKKRKQLSKYH